MPGFEGRLMDSGVTRWDNKLSDIPTEQSSLAENVPMFLCASFFLSQ